MAAREVFETPVPIIWGTRQQAKAVLNCGDTKLHQHINRGRILARKDGRKTLVNLPSCYRYIESLPRAGKQEFAPQPDVEAR